MGFVSIGWDTAEGIEQELILDDGGWDQGWTGGIAGYEMAVVFEPPAYPCTIKKAKIFMTSVGYPMKIIVRAVDSLNFHPGLAISQPDLVIPVTTGWYTAELTPVTIQSGYFSIGVEFSDPNGPAIGSDTSAPIYNRSWDYVFLANEWVLFPENYMIRAFVECSTGSSSTTTTALGGICRLCPILCGLGEGSDEAVLLRTFRDEVLSRTAEGREIIRLYYQWGPLVARAMEADEEFKEEVTEIIQEILPIVGESVE